MLIFPLKKQWYEKIKSGEKTVVYKKVNSIWARRIATTLCPPSCFDSPKEILKEVSSIGFGRKYACRFPKTKCLVKFTGKKLSAYISLIEVVNGKDTDLHIDKPVYAIHLTDVREVEE